MSCSDDTLEAGDGRRGDWLLENSRLQAWIRQPATALTRLGTAGGTVVDLVVDGADDLLEEAIPLVGGEAFVAATLEPRDEGDGLVLRGTLADGAEAEVSWWLAPDEPALHVAGADALAVLPVAGVERVGAILEADGALLAVEADALDDEGGLILATAPARLLAGPRATVHEALWPDGLDVAGQSDGTRVEARDADGAVLARLPVDDDGVFAGRVPARTAALVATAGDRADGEPVAPGDDVAVPAGALGALWLRVAAEDGEPLPATLRLGDGRSFPVPPGGARVPTGPWSGEAWVGAGPAWEHRHLDALEVTGETRLDLTLRRAVSDDRLLAALAVPAWPDPTVGEAPETTVARAAALGAALVVLVADDEVAPAAVADDWKGAVLARGGSRAATDDAGAPYAWPWTPRAADPAHGAAPWAGRDAREVLALMDPSADRITAVDPDWIAAAGPPLAWDPLPTALQVGGLDDLDAYAAVLDQWIPLAALGPLTWLPRPATDAWAAVDLEAAILDGRTVASNGPYLDLTVDGAGPGEEPGGPGDLVLHSAHLVVEAPEWMPLDGVALVGAGGRVLRSWTPTSGGRPRLDVRFLLRDQPWVLAVAWGEEAAEPWMDEPAWAITSPVWLQRP